MWAGLWAGPHLRLEAFHQDGHQQVEEDVVPEGHERHEVESGAGGSGRHAVIKDHVPVLLGQDLDAQTHMHAHKHTGTHTHADKHR